MGEAGRTAAARRAIDVELEALRFHWGDAYEIDYGDEHGCHARRRDGIGGVLTGADPDELYKGITDDYTATPVPRSYAPSDEL